MKYIITLLLFLTPFLLYAGAATPTATFGPLVPCDGPNCDLCALIELGQNVVNFLVLVSIALAAVAFAWAGFLYMTSAGEQGKIKQAHTIFKKVMIGLIIVLGAYLIVNLIVYGLTSQDVDSMFSCP